MTIICGHFPDGAETFDPAVVKDGTKGEWYLRQMLGTANSASPPRQYFRTQRIIDGLEIPDWVRAIGRRRSLWLLE